MANAYDHRGTEAGFDGDRITRALRRPTRMVLAPITYLGLPTRWPNRPSSSSSIHAHSQATGPPSGANVPESKPPRQPAQPPLVSAHSPTQPRYMWMRREGRGTRRNPGYTYASG